MARRRSPRRAGEGWSSLARRPLDESNLRESVANLVTLDLACLRLQWRNVFGGTAPLHCSQANEGWVPARGRYDDGGYSGASLDRTALQALLEEVRKGRIDVTVVYKVDRLTRSLAHFAKLIELFDAHGVSFISITQSFNTTTSMGRLTLNMLLSFAQFEREVTGERIRDKIAASKKKGLWVGGVVPLGYKVVDRRLMVDEAEAPIVP